MSTTDIAEAFLNLVSDWMISKWLLKWASYSRQELSHGTAMVRQGPRVQSLNGVTCSCLFMWHCAIIWEMTPNTWEANEPSQRQLTSVISCLDIHFQLQSKLTVQSHYLMSFMTTTILKVTFYSKDCYDLLSFWLRVQYCNTYNHQYQQLVPVWWMPDKGSSNLTQLALYSQSKVLLSSLWYSGNLGEYCHELNNQTSSQEIFMPHSQQNYSRSSPSYQRGNIVLDHD